MSKKSKTNRETSRADLPVGPMMDRRLMDRSMLQIQKLLSEQDFGSIEEANAFLQNLMADGGLPDISPETPPQEAQELMFQAFDATGAKRVRLARKALTIDPDCADAYCLLAEETSRSPREALRFFRKGVEAGERSLGPAIFQEAAGGFWGLVQTRPYMRAMMGLALAFYAVGQRDDAISTWQRMIELNPGDNQGARNLLIGALLREQRTAESGELLDQYEDEASTVWAYSTALWGFQKEGATPSTERALIAAIGSNKHVVPYLIGEKEPETPPGYYSPGGREDALVYVSEALPAWHATTGAVRWICRSLNIDDLTSGSSL